MKGLVLIGVFLSLGLLQGTDERKNWRGIVPLQSTRADVERILGPPPPPLNDGTRIGTPDPDMPTYRLDDEEVAIGYMGRASAERMSCPSVPLDTVMSIHVSPKNHPPLSELGIDESKFEIFDPSSPPNIGFKAYVDAVDGMYICTVRGRVKDLGYYGSAKDREACPELNVDPKDFCRILVDFPR